MEMQPTQSLDFFGAVRASAYDDQIRAWIVRDVIDGAISEENAGLAQLGARLAQGRDLPEFAPITLTVEGVLEEGRRLAREQELVMQASSAASLSCPSKQKTADQPTNQSLTDNLRIENCRATCPTRTGSTPRPRAGRVSASAATTMRMPRGRGSAERRRRRPRTACQSCSFVILCCLMQHSVKFTCPAG